MATAYINFGGWMKIEMLWLQDGFQQTMSSPPIPDSLLGVERRLTAEQISYYKINAGPGGTWVREWYESVRPELAGYRFYLRGVMRDVNGYYYLTIRKDKDEEDEPTPP